MNKARAIRVKSIMAQDANMEKCDVAVPEQARCEDVLPLFAEHDWIGVVDDNGTQIGYVTAKSVIRALARHQPTIETTAV